VEESISFKDTDLLQAMMSGKNPNYVDIVLNLVNSEFHSDSCISQMSHCGLKTVFYGDETWIKMFPTAFNRMEGTHSFFAADFWEVDSNVTRNVKGELERDDWDVLILHYLGLDHIGHIEGPFSPLIKTKLLEMDEIVRSIFNSLSQKVCFVRAWFNSLLLGFKIE